MTLWHIVAFWAIGSVPLSVLFGKLLGRVSAHYPEVSPRREPTAYTGALAHPTRGTIYREPHSFTGTSGVLVAEDTAETGWK